MGKTAKSSEEWLKELTEKRVTLALKAINLLHEYLELFDRAKEVFQGRGEFNHGEIKDIGVLTGKLIEVVKLVTREDLDQLEPSIEEILKAARVEFGGDE